MKQDSSEIVLSKKTQCMKKGHFYATQLSFKYQCCRKTIYGKIYITEN